MEMKSISTKMIIKMAIAIVVGAALVFALMRVSPSTGESEVFVNFGIPVIAFGAAVFGPVAGFLIGFIGHTLNDLSWGGWDFKEVWWSWVLASAVFGCVIGLFRKRYNPEAGGFGIKECLTFNVVQIITNLIVWIYLARIGDLLNKESLAKVTEQGYVAAGVNIAMVLVLGSLLVWGYSLVMAKIGKKTA